MRGSPAMKPLRAAALCALCACSAPPFPTQHPYPFGLSAAIETSWRSDSGDPTLDASRREAAVAAQRASCPDWDAVRLPHPIDPLFPAAPRSDLPAMGCHTQAAFDAMLARPADLAMPPVSAGPASGAALSRGVTRHREAGPPPLPARADGLEAAR